MRHELVFRQSFGVGYFLQTVNFWDWQIYQWFIKVSYLWVDNRKALFGSSIPPKITFSNFLLISQINFPWTTLDLLYSNILSAGMSFLGFISILIIVLYLLVELFVSIFFASKNILPSPIAFVIFKTYFVFLWRESDVFQHLFIANRSDMKLYRHLAFDFCHQTILHLICFQSNFISIHF